MYTGYGSYPVGYAGYSTQQGPLGCAHCHHFDLVATGPSLSHMRMGAGLGHVITAGFAFE